MMPLNMAGFSLGTRKISDWPSPEQGALAIWRSAPDEQSEQYFRVFSAVSQAVQGTLRGWTREWFASHPEILERHGMTYTFLVYLAAGVYPGSSENGFTYDVQQSDAIHRAFRSALRGMPGELKKLETTHLPWPLRERYFPYRSQHVVAFVKKKHRALYVMFNAETAIVNDLLRFALVDIRSGDQKVAISVLRRSIALRLRRFSRYTNFSDCADELLQVATRALALALEPPDDGEPAVALAA